jgi:hypothetical protein
MTIFGHLISTQEMILFGALLLAFVALSFAAIWDAWGREFGSPTEKLAWIQVAVLFPFVGGVAYFILGRKRGRKV